MKPILVTHQRKGGRIAIARQTVLPGCESGTVLFVPRADATESRGDCFIVINRQGKCWDGVRWTDSWCAAIQFRRPEAAYESCEEAARDAAHLTGMSGMVCYIPPGTPASFVLVPFPDLSQVDLRDFARKPEVC